MASSPVGAEELVHHTEACRIDRRGRHRQSRHYGRSTGLRATAAGPTSRSNAGSRRSFGYNNVLTASGPLSARHQRRRRCIFVITEPAVSGGGKGG